MGQLIIIFHWKNSFYSAEPASLPRKEHIEFSATRELQNKGFPVSRIYRIANASSQNINYGFGRGRAWRLRGHYTLLNTGERVSGKKMSRMGDTKNGLGSRVSKLIS